MDIRTSDIIRISDLGGIERMGQEQGRAKYFILMDSLKEDIQMGKIKPGDKIPSENELSEKFHVSRHTVRKALSILANEGYLEAEHGRGTFCTERAKNNASTHNIAVVTTYISDYIFPRLIQGMDRVLTEKGYSIILKNTGNSQKNEAKALEDIMTKNVDGLIIEPSKSEIYCRHMNQYQKLDELGIPYVFIQGVYPQMHDRPMILMDDVQGAYMLTKYLIDLGHRNIAGIFKIDDTQGKNRHKGYIKALTEAGMVYDPDMVILFHTEDREKKPVEMIKQFIRNKVKMDGIVCYNDQIALEIIPVLNQNHLRVPEDISITGYDNSILAENGTVKLTTIAHPKERLGEMAAELLLEKMNGVEDIDSKVQRIVAPEMIIRNSCIDRRK